MTERGIPFSVLKSTLGIRANGNPAHRLADGHWRGFAAKKTNTQPEFDYESVMVTVAFESDQRLKLEYEIPTVDTDSDGSPDASAPSRGVLQEVVEAAQTWYLAPETVIGLAENGSLQKSGAGRELRNDRALLAARMAGLISRYYQERARAHIMFRGYMPWSDLRGVILETIEEKDTVYQVRSAVTSVDWRLTRSGPETTIKAGYAR